ncbi:MAG: hypothetical protein C0391_06125 [Anaerolinea sp.]|nr:hypothetical protein [Anaerolinea sp.]
MKLPRWSNINMQIMLVVLLPLVAGAIFIVFYSQRLHHEAMQSLVGERNLRTVDALSAGLEGIFTDRINSIISASKGGITDSTPLENYSAMFELDQSGNVITHFNNSLELETLLRELPETEQKWESDLPGEVIISTRLDDSTNKQWMLITVRNQAGALLVGFIDLSKEMKQMVGGIVQPGKVSIQIYDQSHELIYEAGRSPLDEHAFYHPGVLKGLDGEKGVLYPEISHVQGAHVIAFTPLIITSWVLVIDEAWEDVSSAQLDTTQNAPLILIPFILLAVAALWIITRQVVIPLQKLEKQTQALGEGDYSAIDQPVGGIGEVRSLQNRMVDMADNLRKARLSLEGYIGSITRGVEDERLRIAREVHDEPLQSLIALKHRMQSGQEVDPAENKTTVQEVIDDLRMLVRGLRPVILDDLGLAAALETLTRQAEQESGLQVKFIADGDEFRMAPEVELAFFRIAQEAVTNIQKHAHARQVGIHLDFQVDGVRMEITDDGTGFAVPERLDQMAMDGHYGLVGMMERAKAMGGGIEFHSTPGGGTRVTVIHSTHSIPQTRNK